MKPSTNTGTTVNTTPLQRTKRYISVTIDETTVTEDETVKTVTKG